MFQWLLSIARQEWPLSTEMSDPVGPTARAAGSEDTHTAAVRSPAGNDVGSAQVRPPSAEVAAVRVDEVRLSISPHGDAMLLVAELGREDAGGLAGDHWGGVGGERAA